MKKIFFIMYLVFLSHITFADTLDLHFLSEGKYLSAQISRPSFASKKVPAIIFITGSGVSSYKENYKSFVNNFLGDLRSQFLIMMYDKCGVGGSDGHWENEDFHARALDTYNAAKYLQENFKVDEIYLVGHSQGGWIAQLCLAKYGNMFAGAVSMAGPTFSVKEQLANDFQSDFICAKSFLYDKAKRKAERKSSWVCNIASIFPINAQFKQLSTIKRFDIRPYLSKIEKPILYMWAENDRLVYPDKNLKILEDVFNNEFPANFEVYIDPGSNHSFLVSSFCGKPEKDNYSVNSKVVLKEWLKNRKAL